MWRLSGVLIGIVLCGLLVHVTPVAARPRVLLMVRDFHNWLDFSYEYDARESTGGRGEDLQERDHRLEEVYHFDMAYAVYHPRLVNGRLGIDLGLNENWYDGGNGESESDVGTLLEYDLTGTFFDRRPCPISFFSRSARRSIQRRFAGNYDLDTVNHGLSLTWRNQQLPISLGFRRYSSETDGLELDRQQTSDTVTASASHFYGDLSRTEFSLYHADDETDYGVFGRTEDNRTTEYNLTNALTWGDHNRPSTLSSAYLYRNENGTNDSSSSDWRELLRLQLGKALRWTLDYDQRRNEYEDVERREETVGSRLEHQLYDSLSTRLSYEERTLEIDDGSEDEWEGGIGFSYQKQLPAASHLALGYDFTYGETDRRGTADDRFVIGEPLIMELLGPNDLVFADVVAGSITVLSADRLVTYVEGVDYTITQMGRQTELLLTAGSLISPGDQVVVDYRYRVDPGISFATTTNQAFASLSLFSRRYRLYASFYNLDQELLSANSGSGDPMLLSAVTSTMLGMEAVRGYHTCGLEIADYDSTTDARQYVQGVWRYARYFRIHYLMLMVRDRYTRYEAMAEDVGGDDGENVLDAGFAYRRRLPYGAMAGFSVNYLNQRGRDNDRDELDIDCSYKLRVGRLELELQATQQWEWQASRRDRDDRVMLTFRRYL
ncbi:MAG: hypothetical protein JXO49_04245 [Deltaproteobacteria bacterium]|nr:hypothetical protein [Candidatus Anaeroferrophillus wilburensis]MBN2888539.1 hypothetical protein [Deltaproteobacteria bacterium]